MLSFLVKFKCQKYGILARLCICKVVMEYIWKIS